MADREIEVLVRVADADVLAGRLWCHRRRGVESQTFRYAGGYLALPGAYELDPRLPLVEGAQQTPTGRANFGAFSDAAPDRWGRRLIGRAERHRVKRDGGTARSLGEADYLLGVRDDLRQGALRFREPDTQAFLAPHDTGVPSLLDLPRLLGAAERLERDEESEEELAALLRSGSSLGGARPKAHPDDIKAAADLAVDPLERVGAAELGPVRAGQLVEGGEVFFGVFEQLGAFRRDRLKAGDDLAGAARRRASAVSAALNTHAARR